MNEDITQAHKPLRQEAMKRANACTEEYSYMMHIFLATYNCGVQYQGQLQSGLWVPLTDLGFVKGRIDFVPLLDVVRMIVGGKTYEFC